MKRLFGIFESVIRKTGKKSGSKKLFRLILKEINLIAKNPDPGLKTTDDRTRGLIIGNYILFYEVNEKRIIIRTIQYLDSVNNSELQGK